MKFFKKALSVILAFAVALPAIGIPSVSVAATKTTVTLQYLGKLSDDTSGNLNINTSTADRTQALAALDALTPSSTSISEGDILWFGFKFTDIDATSTLSEPMEAFSIAVDYNKKYLAPVDSFADIVFKYNVAPASTNTNPNLWSNIYDTASTSGNAGYQIHTDDDSTKTEYSFKDKTGDFDSVLLGAMVSNSKDVEAQIGNFKVFQENAYVFRFPMKVVADYDDSDAPLIDADFEKQRFAYTTNYMLAEDDGLDKYYAAWDESHEWYNAEDDEYYPSLYDTMTFVRNVNIIAAAAAKLTGTTTIAPNESSLPASDPNKNGAPNYGETLKASVDGWGKDSSSPSDSADAPSNPSYKWYRIYDDAAGTVKKSDVTALATESTPGSGVFDTYVVTKDDIGRSIQVDAYADGFVSPSSLTATTAVVAGKILSLPSASKLHYDTANTGVPKIYTGSDGKISGLSWTFTADEGLLTGDGPITAQYDVQYDMTQDPGTADTEMNGAVSAIFKKPLTGLANPERTASTEGDGMGYAIYPEYSFAGGTVSGINGRTAEDSITSLNSLTISSTNASKLTVGIGDELPLSDFTVNVTYRVAGAKALSYTEAIAEGIVFTANDGTSDMVLAGGTGALNSAREGMNGKPIKVSLEGATGTPSSTIAGTSNAANITINNLTGFIVEGPTKLEYKHGDKIDLTGLKVFEEQGYTDKGSDITSTVLSSADYKLYIRPAGGGDDIALTKDNNNTARIDMSGGVIAVVYKEDTADEVEGEAEEDYIFTVNEVTSKIIPADGATSWGKFTNEFDETGFTAASVKAPEFKAVDAAKESTVLDTVGGATATGAKGSTITLISFKKQGASTSTSLSLPWTGSGAAGDASKYIYDTTKAGDLGTYKFRVEYPGEADTSGAMGITSAAQEYDFTVNDDVVVSLTADNVSPRSINAGSALDLANMEFVAADGTTVKAAKMVSLLYPAPAGKDYSTVDELLEDGWILKLGKRSITKNADGTYELTNAVGVTTSNIVAANLVATTDMEGDIVLQAPSGAKKEFKGTTAAPYYEVLNPIVSIAVKAPTNLAGYTYGDIMTLTFGGNDADNFIIETYADGSTKKVKYSEIVAGTNTDYSFKIGTDSVKFGSNADARLNTVSGASSAKMSWNDGSLTVSNTKASTVPAVQNVAVGAANAVQVAKRALSVSEWTSTIMKPQGQTDLTVPAGTVPSTKLVGIVNNDAVSVSYSAVDKAGVADDAVLTVTYKVEGATPAGDGTLTLGTSWGDYYTISDATCTITIVATDNPYASLAFHSEIAANDLKFNQNAAINFAELLAAAGGIDYTKREGNVSGNFATFADAAAAGIKFVVLDANGDEAAQLTAASTLADISMHGGKLRATLNTVQADGITPETLNADSANTLAITDSVASIAIVSQPNTEYGIGEALDLTNLKLAVNMLSGAVKYITPADDEWEDYVASVSIAEPDGTNAVATVTDPADAMPSAAANWNGKKIVVTPVADGVDKVASEDPIVIENKELKIEKGDGVWAYTLNDLKTGYEAGTIKVPEFKLTPSGAQYTYKVYVIGSNGEKTEWSNANKAGLDFIYAAATADGAGIPMSFSIQVEAESTNPAVQGAVELFVNEFTINANPRPNSNGGGGGGGTTVVVPIEEPDDRLIIDIPVIPDDAADRLYMRGYLSEDATHKTFRPTFGITRAEVATLIARLLPDFDESLSYDPEALEFGDVAGDSWYRNYIYFAVKNGLVNGYEDGSFRPDQTISRQEFAAVIARYLKLTNEGEAEYSDAQDMGTWATGYIAQLSRAWLRQGEGTEPFEGEILNGYEDGSFRPLNDINRAEVTKVLNRVFGRIPNEDKIKANIDKYDISSLTDVPDTYWAYYEILEASIEHTHGDFH